jgi:hypothetical protein
MPYNEVMEWIAYFDIKAKMQDRAMKEAEAKSKSRNKFNGR